MKLLSVVAVLALIGANAAYADSGTMAPTNLAPKTGQAQASHNNASTAAQSRSHKVSATKESRAQMDRAERLTTAELNRQQLAQGGTAPQTASRPGATPTNNAQ